MLKGEADTWQAGLAKARSALARGEPRLAVWIAHRVLLGLLDERGAIHSARGKTNTDYLSECAPTRPEYETLDQLTSLCTDVLLGDEIHRAPAKTQAALLEAMQERQVNIDGQMHPLPPSFTVIATQNPVGFEGTYPLPETQLDRFMLKLAMGYPGEAEGRQMLKTTHELGAQALNPLGMLTPVATADDLAQIRASIHGAQADAAVLDYVLALIRHSRSLPSLALGASPRAGVMLPHAAKALAVLRGKDYLTPDEVQAVAYPVLRHRVRLTPEAEIERLTPDACIKALLGQVAVPR